MATNDTSRLNTRGIPPSSSSAPVVARLGSRPIWERAGVAAAVLSILSACNTSGGPKIVLASGSTAKVSSFVAADEATAAAIGRDVLRDGGTAFDAAAAVGLALTVTMPSRAGLAGGGVCVVHDATAKSIRTLDFTPRGTGGIAAPAALRAFSALQAARGKLRWERIVGPVEARARRMEVSSGLAADLAAWGGRLDPAARRALMPSGSTPVEGAAIQREELGELFGEVRRLGPAAFHSQDKSEALARAMGIDQASVRDSKPVWRETIAVDFGASTAHFADTGEAAGGPALARAAEAMEKADKGSRLAAALNALKPSALPGDEAPAVGFAVVDSEESAVACALTMGAPFGTGKSVPGFGLLSAVPTRGPGFGAPVLQTADLMGRTANAMVGVARGSDGPLAAQAGLLAVAVPALVDEVPPADAIAKRPSSAPGSVVAVACFRDTWGGLEACQPVNDPRAGGSGFTVNANY